MSGPLSRVVRPDDLHGDRPLRIEATAEERREIADLLGLIDLKALSAEVEVELGKGGMATVSGKVTGEVVQRCVVSLEPVNQKVEEHFSRRYVPERSKRADGPGIVDVDHEEEDPPEVYSGTGIDVGAAVFEQFVLGVDPYPRAPGVKLEPSAAGEQAGESPFSVLKSLGHSRS